MSAKTIPYNAFSVTTSDTNYLNDGTKNVSGSLFIGTGGNVNVLPEGAAETNDPTAGIVFKNVPSGAYLVGQFKKVFATSTTASDIVCQHD